MPMDPLHPKRRARGKHGVPPHAAEAGELARGVGEYTQLALWMAASLAGMVTALLVARRPFFEALLRTAGGGKKSAARPRASRPARKALSKPTPEESLPMLAEAIVGNTKAAV